MASTKEIVIDIDPDGGTHIEAKGFSDGGCLKETKALEEALGVVDGRTKKAEAFVPEKVKTGNVKLGK